MSNYQIFISYRRDGEDVLAGRLALAQRQGVLLVLPPNISCHFSMNCKCFD